MEKELGRRAERVTALDFQAIGTQLTDFAAASGFLTVEQQAQVTAILERGEQLKVPVTSNAAVIVLAPI